MLAIILAAGRGSRLAEYNPDQRPKCLLEFAGISLMQRHLVLLQSMGITAVHIVTGYKADRIVSAVEKIQDKPDIVWHYNSRYLEGSTISLLAAATALQSDDEVLIMDADVLYSPQILEKLVKTEITNAFLLDRDFEDGPEPVKIAISDHCIVEFRKRIPDDLIYDKLGESVGFFRFNSEAARWIETRCRQYDQKAMGEQPHEEVLRDLVLESNIPINIVDVSGMAWIEIDFPEDVERARTCILPAIEKMI